MKIEDNSYFCDVAEVRKLFNCGDEKARNIIRQLNNELNKKGYLTFKAKVPKRYLYERFGISQDEKAAK